MIEQGKLKHAAFLTLRSAMMPLLFIYWTLCCLLIFIPCAGSDQHTVQLKTHMIHNEKLKNICILYTQVSFLQRSGQCTY